MAGSRVPRRALLATVALAIVATIVLAAISARGGSDSATGTRLDIAGIPQKGDTLGPESASVQIVEYADLQCPFCAEAASQTIPTLIERYVRPGTARLVFRPLTFIGDDSVRGAVASAAAGIQNKQWQFLEYAFDKQEGENSGWLSDALITEAAKASGLDLGAFERDRTASDAQTAVARAAQQAQNDRVTSTPSFIVTGPKGTVPIRDYRNLAEFASAVNAVK